MHPAISQHLGCYAVSSCSGCQAVAGSCLNSNPNCSQQCNLQHSVIDLALHKTIQSFEHASSQPHIYRAACMFAAEHCCVYTCMPPALSAGRAARRLGPLQTLHGSHVALGGTMEGLQVGRGV